MINNNNKIGGSIIMNIEMFENNGYPDLINLKIFVFFFFFIFLYFFQFLLIIK